MTNASPRAAKPVPREIPEPRNLLADANPIDCLHNVDGVLALLLMVNFENDVVPIRSSSGHQLLMMMARDALRHAERLLVSESALEGEL